MRRGRVRRAVAPAEPPEVDLDGLLPGCGEQAWLSCRRATQARTAAGGPVAGCPLAASVPVHQVDQVDQVLDLLDDVCAAAQTWTALSWAAVVRASVRGVPDGPALLDRAAHCVAVTGRQALLRHGEGVLLQRLPPQAGTVGRLALADALAAVVVSDVLPTHEYLALTHALVAGLA